MSRGFDKLSNAQQFRDYFVSLIKTVVDDVRPKKSSGTVLRVYRDGPMFKVSAEFASPDPNLAPPISPGNPQQVFYADVRLDTGEIVKARVQQDIPYSRDATWWDGSQPLAGQQFQPYFIVDGVYRNRTTVVRTDYLGNSYNSIEPDLTTTVGSFPYVPPRVFVEGSAGKYMINEIIRGIAGNRDAYFRGAAMAGLRTIGIQNLASGGRDIKVVGEDLVWFNQGWVGNTGFRSTVNAAGRSASFEVELSYGDTYQKYIINSKYLLPDSYNWMICPPVYESYSTRRAGLPADQTQNVLLATADAAGAIHFYVCSADLSGNLFTASDLFLNGSVRVRSIQGPLVQVPGSTMPDITLNNFQKFVAGYGSSAGVLVQDKYQYARPAFRPKLSQDLLHLRNNLTVGNARLVDDGSGGVALTWDKFSTVTATSIYKDSPGFDIVMPAVGTAIPVVGAFETSAALPTVTTVAAGIPMNQAWSLYYVLPIGVPTGSVSLDNNFIFVNQSGAFDIPEHWILIAQRNTTATTGAYLKLGTGRELDTWKVMTPASGFAASSGHTPVYKKENGRLYCRGGFAATGSRASGSTLFTLPVGYRPFEYSFQLAPYDFAIARLDVGTTGVMLTRTSMASGVEVFIDNVSFEVTA